MYVPEKLLTKNKLIEKLLHNFIWIKVQGSPPPKKKASRPFKTPIYMEKHLLTIFPHKPIMHILLALHFKKQET